jgi:fumarate reductase subunit D
MTFKYPLALLPGLLGIIVGVLVTMTGLGESKIVQTFTGLAEFRLWQTVMIIQLSVYITILFYLWLGTSKSYLPSLSSGEAWLSAIITAILVLLPNILVQPGEMPLPAQRVRLLVVVASALCAILLLTNRLAKIHKAFGEVNPASKHLSLRKEVKDLLLLAAIVVTMATIGSAVLQDSLQALENASDDYTSPVQLKHVVSYGAYSTLLLFLFFAPVLSADNRGAVKIREAMAGEPTSEAESESLQELDTGLRERLGSVLGVLSPLLGALASQLLP